jgi:predicted acyl esterase
MSRPSLCAVALALTLGAALAPGRPLAAQPARAVDTALVAERWRLERELQELAVVERKVMVRMRDGVRVQADVYRPRDTTRTYPVVLSRTPYNFNYWDVRLGAPRAMTAPLDAVRRGYAYVEMNERGHFWSEGHYDILGAPRTDGTDAIEWLAARPWVERPVGLIGCSSTAEWQMAVAADRPKGLAAIVPQGFGAGVGRMRPYYEQGNWYRGGATQMLFIAWLYGEQNQLRPMFPPGTSQADLVRAARMFDLAPQMPPVDWAQALRHLPVQDILRNVGATPGSSPTRCPCPPGGRMAQRAPNDSAWYRGGLFHDDMTIATPGLWFISWYDVSAGPNLATYNHVRRTAPARGGRAAVRRHRPRAPLRVQARHRADRHRRAPHGRRAPRLRRADVGLVRHLPQGRAHRAARHAAQGPLLHDGQQPLAGVAHLAARGRPRGDVLPGERRAREHAARRRPPRRRAAGRRPPRPLQPTTR